MSPYAHLLALVLTILWVGGGGVSATDAQPFDAVLDDFDENDGWLGPVYYYDPLCGAAHINDGALTITHYPTPTMQLVEMEKTLTLDFAPNTWVHFRFKELQRLLGADMYAHIYVDGVLLCQVGVNGEQFFVMGRCNQGWLIDTYEDDVFFSSPVIYGDEWGRNNDIRVALADELQDRIAFDAWSLWSVKYDETDGVRRVRIFIDGREIIYRQLDDPYPDGWIDNRLRDDVQIAPGANLLRITLGILSDGGIYNDTSVNDGCGVRWLQAFADITPALPDSYVPSQALKQDAQMSWDFLMITHRDNVWQINTEIRDMLFTGRVGVSTAVFLELIDWQQAEDWCPWMSPQEKDAIRNHPLGSPLFCHPHGYASGLVVADGPAAPPLENARIEALGTPYVAYTDQNGAYRLRLPPGAYTIQASYETFDPVTGPVMIADGATETLDLVLNVHYALTTEAIGDHGALLPGDGDFPYQTTVNLTAHPDPGYMVQAWHGTDNDSLTTNTNTVTMHTARTVSVEFAVVRHELITTVVSGRGGLTPLSGTHPHGALVDLTAYPQPGYTLAFWTGTNDDLSTQTTNQVLMDRHQTVQVSFARLMPGDLNISNRVDLNDLNVLAERWAQPGAILYPVNNGRVVMEAEHYSRRYAGTATADGISWLYRAAAHASAQGYLHCLPDRGQYVPASIISSAPHLHYDVYFPAAGTYYFWVKGRAADHTADSLYYGLDGVPRSTVARVLTGTSFAWSCQEIYAAQTPTVLTVPSAGPHHLDIWMCEDGVEVDSLLLTDDQNDIPQNPVESAHTCADTNEDGAVDIQDLALLAEDWLTGGTPW